MDVKTLKKAIEEKTLSDSPIILKYEDNDFLCKQYVNTICKNKQLDKFNISSIEEVLEAQDDLFGSGVNKLFVLEVNKLTEYPTPAYKNLVVICKEVPDNLDIDYTDMTKAVNWQIEEFAKMRLPGLSEEEVNWLCSICGYDIFRIDQECKKLEIFPVGAQRVVFQLLNKENGYCDLTNMNIFNFTDAVIIKDLKTVGELIPDLLVVDIEPLGVVTIMLKKFKNIYAIQTNCQSAIKALGMSDKQVWFLKKNQCGIYTDAQLLRNIEFLTGIDSRIKSGNLEMPSKDSFLAYLTQALLH